MKSVHQVARPQKNSTLCTFNLLTSTRTFKKKKGIENFDRILVSFRKEWKKKIIACMTWVFDTLIYLLADIIFLYTFCLCEISDVNDVTTSQLAIFSSAANNDNFLHTKMNITPCENQKVTMEFLILFSAVLPFVCLLATPDNYISNDSYPLYKHIIFFPS